MENASKERNAQDMLDDLKKVKLGLLKIANTAAQYGKTVTEAGHELSFRTYGKNLTNQLDVLKVDVEHIGLLTDTLLHRNIGETFRIQKMQIQRIRKGVHDLAEAAENGEAAIIVGDGKTLSVFAYASDLIDRINSLEKSMATEINKTGSEIKAGKTGYGPFYSIE